jgi:hypothetical protein
MESTAIFASNTFLWFLPLSWKLELSVDGLLPQIRCRLSPQCSDMKMKRYFTSVISLLPAKMIILGENFIWGIVGVTLFDQSAVPTDTSTKRLLKNVTIG